MRNNREIWLLMDSRAAGGIETHVLQLALYLKSRDIAVRVIFLQDWGLHPIEEKFRETNIPYTKLNRGLKDLVKLVKYLRPLVLHTHGYKAGIYGKLLGVFRDQKVISTYHSGDPGRGKVAIYDWLDRMLAGIAQYNFSVSDEISKRIPYRSEVIKNFVMMPDNVSHGNQIAFVGRLSWEKAPDRMLEIAELMPDRQFSIYGKGEMQDKLVSEAGSNVKFYGEATDMARIWRDTGLLVLPSRHEGLPMVALEAMSYGIPVVASRVGDLAKLIQSGKNGWLIDEYEPMAFANCISNWLALPDERKAAIRSAARKTIAARYSSESCAKKVLSAYSVVNTRFAQQYGF